MLLAKPVLLKFAPQFGAIANRCNGHVPVPSSPLRVAWEKLMDAQIRELMDAGLEADEAKNLARFLENATDQRASVDVVSVPVGQGK
jgi:hypothetical protein